MVNSADGMSTDQVVPSMLLRPGALAVPRLAQAVVFKHPGALAGRARLDFGRAAPCGAALSPRSPARGQTTFMDGLSHAGLDRTVTSM
ncbi:hypothetical protein HNP84_005272 [Thermocatellispora tengchongensis]|uniref:Uncharacterized protein n=1 Tax=Thermocatellispora tengchongensis TaxID=1073253 RepID=A0A840P782_9ACTN|nr:hypothetical protein [Thermocatellispora tengchongensis]MBB5135528.1 hypothetical protein [Thermocatellispora tengchongensis]